MSTRTLRTLVGLALATTSLAGAALSAGASTKTVRAVKVERVAMLGEVLFSAKGFALYTYARDTKNHSNCNGSCLAAWPALTVPGGVRPTGTAGLGVMVRSNGQHQVTWRGRPLYLFASDTTRGRVSGNGVAGFHVALVKPLASGTTTTAGRYGGY